MVYAIATSILFVISFCCRTNKTSEYTRCHQKAYHCIVAPSF